MGANGHRPSPRRTFSLDGARRFCLLSPFPSVRIDLLACCLLSAVDSTAHTIPVEIHLARRLLFYGKLNNVLARLTKRRGERRLGRK
ncbi:hypothetical protein KIN20_026682 [Parelaphostrongylus tenuis]|uniref:Uncharacterized protein n=1 Tax=Parelaphostrongylus tenuis TaxID=148309 RepID=A0AAD5QY90_PARTN|nr:hypothetical protein KIN20_026682 [Parelaphostrongylus tenuis]